MPTTVLDRARRRDDSFAAADLDDARTTAERRRLVRRAIVEGGIEDERVIAAMGRVPRHQFVSRELRHLAYDDQPLPIPGRQTISQPFVVALMAQAAELEPGQRCLEVGTGSGYQAAVLAEICGEVYSIEYLDEVFAFGQENLRRTGYLGAGVTLRCGDGYGGWPEQAPFDAILVAAAPERVPQPLLDQLAPGGRLVVPVGPRGAQQDLEVWRRVRPGTGSHLHFVRESLVPVRFVPFLGGEGG